MVKRRRLFSKSKNPNGNPIWFITKATFQHTNYKKRFWTKATRMSTRKYTLSETFLWTALWVSFSYYNYYSVMQTRSPAGQRCIRTVSPRLVLNVWHEWRDRWTNRQVKTLSKHVGWSFVSVQDLTLAKNSRETRYLHRRNGRTDGPTDRRTDRPS